MELAKEVGDTILIEAIPFILLDLGFLIDQDDQLTPDMFKELVPRDIRKYYDTRVGDEEVYKLGAGLQSLIQQKKMELERRFGRSYFVFWYGSRRVFGVNLFGNPRLAIWGTEVDESKFSEFDNKPVYYPVHHQWVFPRGTTVEEIQGILECVYNEARCGEQMPLF